MRILQGQKPKIKKVKSEGPNFHLLKFSVVRAKCPACKHSNSRISLTLIENSKQLILLACRGCGSLYYPNAEAPDYQIVENEDSFYMRIDQAEGIDSALMPLFSVPALNDFAVIDVGCGLGFTSDFIRFQGRECLAFDPSSAAQISSKILNITISQELAAAGNTKTKNPSKLVFASEVIEHVENPLEFLEELRDIAGADGYLIVTTPNAGFVKKGNSTNTIMAMLAPSQHLFLLSAKSLEDLARKAGFAWAKTWTQEERLFLVAGPRVQEIANCFSRPDYINYLKARPTKQDTAEDIRYRSFGYRLFKEYVHGGEYDDANKLWKKLSTVFDVLGFDLKAPVEIVQMYERAAGMGKSLPQPKLFPYNMALILFLKGTLLIASDHDRVAAKPYFEGAIEISELYRKVFTKDIFQAYDLELQNVSKWALEQMRLHSI